MSSQSIQSIQSIHRLAPRAALALLVLLVFSPSLAAAKPPSGPSAAALIERAKAAAADGTVDPARDLAPLLQRLAASHDESDQDDLVRAVDSLGRHDGTSPAAVKAYLREAAPPVLLAIARSKAPTGVRCNALMALRSLNAADAVLDEAIAIARAETGPAQHEIGFRGELLANWKESRQSGGPAPGAPTPGAPATERAALEFLRRHHQPVSADNLGQAALRAETDVVVALLDAGVDVNATVAGGLTPLGEAGGIGCVGSEAAVDARLATIDALLQHGANVKWRDSLGNTILMHGVLCPVPVVAKLVAAGAPLDAVNAQGFTPLMMAFAQGKWDVAELLVEHGARLSRKAMDQLFFEKPTDPKKLALIRRATAK
ncbi:MAG TPA: ankyrin repeat domain-containing protein [Thermoanaerobaculia bacterium]|nr:ankyrin repeat domain-containing protein [Thermoanaerobaculia bacterium]